jgi:putative nucleotidyltransferase with HDIG domain
MASFPRLTFLVRFSFVTFLSAAVAAVILAFVLETVHRQAVERDETLDAVAHVESVFTPLVDRLAHGSVPQWELARAARDADVFNYVTGVSLYDVSGDVIYPLGSQPQPADVAAALAKDALFVVQRSDTRLVYAPLVSSDGTRTFVVSVALSQGQMAARSDRERWLVYGSTGGGVAIIFFSLIALAAGASRELERRRRESQASFVETLGFMARTLDLRDPYTAGHSERVAEYSRALATELGLDERQLIVVHSGALLHDLGKIAVPDSVLFKPARLDPAERRMIEVHPTLGASLLSSVTSMEDVVPCVLHHHEKVDGSGYPHGLRGESIPLGARIIAVADAFDAMTTDRPYRRGLSSEEALREILDKAGAQFDPRCAKAFATLVSRGAIVPPATRAHVAFARKIELTSPTA